MCNFNLYQDGRNLPLGDGKIRLSRIKNRDDAHIRVYAKQNADGEKILCMASGIENDEASYRMAATKWLREYARMELSKKVQYFADKMNVTVGRIAIKEQKTRWASCSSKGNLNFNWKLALMPEKIQNYVVVHELAHRKQMNHSREFWAEVKAVLPEYQEYRKWLREHEREFIEY